MKKNHRRRIRRRNRYMRAAVRKMMSMLVKMISNESQNKKILPKIYIISSKLSLE